MNKLLEEILSSNQVKDDQEQAHVLHSHTKRGQCEFLQKMVKEAKPEQSLEIGLAYGISTLAILDELKNSGNPYRHIVIDPFQDSWQNIGLLNIERAGFSDHVTFERKFSDQVIPKLYYENYRIQFAYIDSTKVLDILMTDVYFITKILNVNGLLVLDDCGFPGIRILVRFLSQHPSYRIFGTYDKDNPSKKVQALKSLYQSGLKLIPFKNKTLPLNNFSSDEELGVNYGCIAFRKVKEDDRQWDWHANF
jgi:predicted O-methyltransferase YrrM